MARKAAKREKRGLKGTGTVFQRGNKWTYAIDLGKDEKGERQRKFIGGFNSEKEARLALAEALTNKKKNILCNTNDTVKQYAENWLENHIKGLSFNTKRRYTMIVTKRIIPYLGTIKLEELKPIDIKNFYNRILKEGRLDGKEGELGYTSFLYHKKVLNNMLKTAVFDEKIYRNPAQSVALPMSKDKVMEYENKKVHIFTPEQISLIEEKAIDSPYFPEIYTLIRTGLRRSELYALQWERDINLDAGTLTVNKAVYQIKKEDDKPRIEEKPPKSKKSKRTIDISPELVKFLRQHKAKQAEHKLILGKKYQKNDLVFCRDDGKPKFLNSISNWFPKFLAKIGLQSLNVHSLRHTHISLMLASGADIKLVSERAGHSSVSITWDVYSHVLPKKQKEAVNNFEDMLKVKPC